MLILNQEILNFLLYLTHNGLDVYEEKVFSVFDPAGELVCRIYPEDKQIEFHSLPADKTNLFRTLIKKGGWSSNIN